MALRQIGTLQEGHRSAGARNLSNKNLVNNIKYLKV
jgi:hypothetical protein